MLEMPEHVLNTMLPPMESAMSMSFCTKRSRLAIDVFLRTLKLTNASRCELNDMIQCLFYVKHRHLVFISTSKEKLSMEHVDELSNEGMYALICLPLRQVTSLSEAVYRARMAVLGDGNSTFTLLP